MRPYITTLACATDPGHLAAMEIGVIGTGRMGRTLARAFAGAGHRIWLGSRDPERSRGTASELATAITSNVDAAARAEVVFLAYHSNDALLEHLEAATAGKVVVDVSTYAEELGPDFDPAAELPISQQELTQRRLPRARVVGAFQVTFAELFEEPMLDGERTRVLVVGDDAEAKRCVIDLVRALPFEPIDGGPLRRARELASAYLLARQRQEQRGMEFDWRAATRELRSLW